MTTQVTVHLYATFRQYAKGQRALDVPIEPGQTVEQLLDALGVPIDQVRILFCNNRLIDRSHQLNGGENVGVFPAIGGG